jgi:aspartate/methionine/tyrosine aminotransferase
VSFKGLDLFCLLAVDEYEKGYIAAKKEGKCVQAILLCYPHNPLGLYREKSRFYEYSGS